jgi:hypothetical protein
MIELLLVVIDYFLREYWKRFVCISYKVYCYNAQDVLSGYTVYTALG